MMDTVLLVRLILMGIFGLVIIVAAWLLVWLHIEELRTKRAELQLETERLHYEISHSKFPVLFEKHHSL